MTPCERFENEGLVHFVAGEPLDPHFETCSDCRSALASYQALTSALAQARERYAPPGDWEARVWARIQRGEGARRRPLAFVLGLGVTAAALAFLLFNTSIRGPEALALAVHVERGSGAAVRGGASGGQSAAPGDVLHLLAKVPRGKVGDVRVYRGSNELVFQCATSPNCRHSQDALEARVTLERAGTYRTIAIAADKELPAATGSLDADYAAARRSGSAEESPPLEVL